MTEPKRQYRIVPGGKMPEHWVVIPQQVNDEDRPAAIATFLTEEEAQAEADRLNEVADTAPG